MIKEDSNCTNAEGMFGDGEGKWQLEIIADKNLNVVNMLRHNSSGDYINLSTVER